ncbi:thioesterase family protein [Bradyrhizobium sp. 48]|uniref:thioesterase family protein n=1 Tax=Bradyrhizobium sp. 48 TaxID=2782676 RepID=UPI001FF99588|nr:thioesterase family protein [Bradyrhizobium sp. 48]
MEDVLTLAKLDVGLVHRETMEVTPTITVPGMGSIFPGFSAMPAVFATAYLVGFSEWTCMRALVPFLAIDQKTVGLHIALDHIAATPVGMHVTAEVELTAIEGRKLRFRIDCRDDRETIGPGIHDRFIIDGSRFDSSLNRKLSAWRQGT